MAASLASVPELQTKTLEAECMAPAERVLVMICLDSSPTQGLWYRLEVWTSVRACALVSFAGKKPLSRLHKAPVDIIIWPSPGHSVREH